MSDIVQTSFDYGLLTPGQAERTQNAEIRIIGRTQKAIIDNGKDLLAVKADIGHGHFLNWLQSLGIDERTAQRWMGVAENFREIRHGDVFENRALYLLSSSKVPESAREEAKGRAADGEKITEEIARQIRDAHKAKEQAEEAQRKAEEKAQLAQQLLFNEKMQSQETIKKLNLQITALQKEREDLSKPNEVVKEVDKPETIARLKKLEADIEKAIQQRDNLSKLVDELSADLDANEAKREQEARDLRVRMEWQKASDTMYKSVIKFLGQLPTPIDTQNFEADDWAILNQVIESFQRGIDICRSLRGNQSLLFIDAEMRQ